ncbi:ammonium transporter Rh type B-like [Penaeus japonicus]|uniref:ammonium transporter Rh type B-like n=1 Tax=Penaeus japonicus TaxID=27405 RepID=UPI001C7105F3|nr:ammonium transporter Rh type B-like [Penaeus japonicus]
MVRSYGAVDYAHYSTEVFQDIHVMIIIGFGFLMTFLKRYGFSAVSLNLLLSSVTLQVAILVDGIARSRGDYIKLNILTLMDAEFACATVLISFGAVLGKASATQLVLAVLLEIPSWVINKYIGVEVLGVVDLGGSILVHVFGAYFGLGMSKMLSRRVPAMDHDQEGSTYHSDIFSMIGTTFLWVFWPSFNAVLGTERGAGRAVINTYLALAAAVVAAFVTSAWKNEPKHKAQTQGTNTRPKPKAQTQGPNTRPKHKVQTQGLNTRPKHKTQTQGPNPRPKHKAQTQAQAPALVYCTLAGSITAGTGGSRHEIWTIYFKTDNEKMVARSNRANVHNPCPESDGWKLYPHIPHASHLILHIHPSYTSHFNHIPHTSAASFPCRRNKWEMVHVQNATLAGGVAVGAVADLMLQPWGALILGFLSGLLSTLGYMDLQPMLAKRLGLHDTCGVNNLHGMPGLLSGIVSVGMALLASETIYGKDLYLQYPMMAPAGNTSALLELTEELPDAAAGSARTSAQQALCQGLALLLSMLLAGVTGAVTGFLLTCGRTCESPRREHLFADDTWWEVPDADVVLEADRSGRDSGKLFSIQVPPRVETGERKGM